MLLARESLDLDRSLQTEGTLLATLLREPAVTGTFTVPIEDRPQQVRVSPDGRTIAVSTNSNMMRFYDTRTHRVIRTEPLINADYVYVRSTGLLFAAAPATRPLTRCSTPSPAAGWANSSSASSGRSHPQLLRARDRYCGRSPRLRDLGRLEPGQEPG